MKHVTIIIPHGHTSIVNIDGTHQILTEVNKFAQAMGGAGVFDVHLAGISSEASQRNGLYTVRPDLLIKDIAKTDIVIIPAIHGDPVALIEENKAFLPWIVEQYRKGAEVVSLCIGSFLLASTGLLDGRKCSTHWASSNMFRSMFPKVLLVDDKIVTEQDRIYTSGGAYAYLNLLLYLIEKHAGRNMAVMVSKAFMIDIDRNSQSPFIIFTGQKVHDDEEIKRAQEYIEQNFCERITVGHLAVMLALSRRSLERRFKKATSNTVTEYIQRVKIEAAKKDFETSRKNINEVMYEIGYSDTKAFRTTFKKITGLSPIAYRNKYNKEMIGMTG